MTDQTIPDVTDDERSLARKWAEDIESDMDTWGDGIRAAARVILDAVPAPAPPTLADMTEEERHACQWMQADVRNFNRRMVITEVRTSSADLIERDGERWNVDLERVTPRPDLPRLEWPGTEKPAPAPALPDGWRLADHPNHGRVIVTTTTPDDDGDFYFMFPADDLVGYDWDACDPAELTYIDQEADTSDTVQPNTLAEGSVWEDADALTRACAGFWRDQIVVADKRGSVGVWDTGMQCWRVTAPHAKFAPYTIIHAGKKADQ